MDSCDAFVDSLMEEAVVMDHTSQVVTHDLISLSLTQGRSNIKVAVTESKVKSSRLLDRYL